MAKECKVAVKKILSFYNEIDDTDQMVEIDKTNITFYEIGLDSTYIEIPINLWPTLVREISKELKTK